MAIDFPVGNDFPANGNQIPDGEIYEGFYWDAATGAWKRLCERDKIGDCLDDNTNETVCDKLDELQREIVELEEEIDAIATSVDRGSWAWDFNVTNYLDARLGSGKFYMVREPDLAVVTEYKDAARIVFHEDDLEGENHVFDDTMIDRVLMLFDRPDDDFLESVITAVETTSGTHGTAYIVHVNVAQSKGSPTNAPDAQGVYKARLNIFEQPSGGTVGEYVLKAGGDPGGVMSGILTMGDTTQMPSGSNTDSPTITFKAKNSSGNIRTHTLQLKSSGTTLYSSSAFQASGSISAGGNIQYNGSDRINMGSSSSIHELKIGSSIALQWDNTYGVRGIRAANSWGGNGKYLAYSSSYGLIWETPPSNTTTNYVKTNSTGFSNNLTITKSGGVYYITGG